MSGLTTPTIPVSWGELLDKLTILGIKRVRITAAEAHANVTREHDLLHRIAAPALEDATVAALFHELAGVNEALWGIEDAIRAEDAAGRFGAVFVDLARAVYRTNDRRAAIKRQIDVAIGSELTEEKSYWSAAPNRSP